MCSIIYCNISNVHIFFLFLFMSCHLASPFVNRDQVHHFSVLCGVKEYLHMRRIICVLLHVLTRLSHLMVHYPNYMFFGRFSIKVIKKCICSLLTSHILLCFKGCVYLFNLLPLSLINYINIVNITGHFNFKTDK